MSEIAEAQFTKHGKMIEETTSKIAEAADQQFIKHGELMKFCCSIRQSNSRSLE